MYSQSSGTSQDWFSVMCSEIKKNLAPDPDVLSSAWGRLMTALEKEVKEMQEKKQDIIPQIDYEAISENNGHFPNANDIKKRGVVVVRNLLSESEALEYRDELKDYLKLNAGKYGDPGMFYEIYWAKPQVNARQHERMHTVMNALNGLWYASEETDVDFGKSVLYVDRLRIRPPRARLGLVPHIDGGCIERWADETYRNVYKKILEGNWEDYDPFDGTYRVNANMNLHGTQSQCTFFRTFQGWLSFSNTGPGLGTLQVFPLLKESISYVMLRPFLDDVPSDVFCGAALRSLQILNKEYHQLIHDNVVTIPNIKPGDAVFWHCDGVHAVEEFHNGDEEGIVFYIPSGPDCPINRKYLEKLRESFFHGKTPPDFGDENLETKFENRARPEDLTSIGKKIMMISD